MCMLDDDPSRRPWDAKELVELHSPVWAGKVEKREAERKRRKADEQARRAAKYRPQELLRLEREANAAIDRGDRAQAESRMAASKSVGLEGTQPAARLVVLVFICARSP